MKITGNENEKYQSLIYNFVLKNREESEKYKTLSLTETFYVSMISCIIIHMIYSAIFYVNSINILTYFNIGSSIFYIGMYVLSKKGYSYFAFALTHIEIVIYTIIGTICLGWESGFSYLMLCFLGTIQVAEFKNAHTKYIALAIEIMLFFALKIYCMYNEAIYINEVTSNFINAMFLFNVSIYIVEVLFFAIYNAKTTLWLQRKLFEQNETLNKIAKVDQLTKLHNRRSMDELLEKTYNDSLANGENFSIAICDIDDFKHVNDTYGHQCGDFILYKVACIIAANIRELDIACRWGGEELLIIYPSTDIKSAVSQTEKIRKAIEDSIFSYKNNELKITVTFGVCNSDGIETIDSLITEADRRLYEGKKNSKNCVIF